MKKKKIFDFLTNTGIEKFINKPNPLFAAFQKFKMDNGDASYSYFVQVFNQYESAYSGLPDKLTVKNLNLVIDEFPRKHKQGFTSNEINCLLKKFGIDKKKFNTELGINTVMMIDGETVTFDNDIEKSLRCLLEGRTKNVFGWD